MNQSRLPKLLPLAALMTSLALAGCAGPEGEKPQRSFRIDLVNLTANQPMSPPVAATTDHSWWNDGSAASIALEHLAEGGDASALIDGEKNAVQTSSLLLPGMTASLTLKTDDERPMLSLATMLVNTNDAFSGLTAEDLSDLHSGEQRILWLPARDAGTEANSESAATIPGPAGGGEGFNADRDDVTGVVTLHPGVVGAEAGASGSALDASHRFDNPVLRVTISAL